MSAIKPFTPMEFVIAGEVFTIETEIKMMCSGYTVKHPRWGSFAWHQVESSVSQKSSPVALLKFAFVAIETRYNHLRALPKDYISKEGHELIAWANLLFNDLPDVERKPLKP